MNRYGKVFDVETGAELRAATRGDWLRARKARGPCVDDGRTVRCEGPADDPDHFDHDRHTRALEEAVHALRSSGRRDADALAGAVSRAAALHRDMQGRVAHAAHAMRQLDLARRHLVSTPTTTACLPLALDRVRRARDLLDQYVAKREAPWIEPAPVLFPFVDALVAGRSGLDEDGVTTRWRALLRTPVVDGFAEVEILEDLASEFVRVRTVEAYTVHWTHQPVKLELTLRRDALVAEVMS